jgi:hypothetical protein
MEDVSIHNLRFSQEYIFIRASEAEGLLHPIYNQDIDPRDLFLFEYIQKNV